MVCSCSLCLLILGDSSIICEPFDFPRTGTVDVGFCSFISIPVSQNRKPIPIELILQTMDGTVLARCSENLKDLSSGSNFTFIELSMNNKNGIKSVNARVHAANQPRWQDCLTDADLNVNGRFVFPDLDSQAAFLYDHIMVTALQSNPDRPPPLTGSIYDPANPKATSSSLVNKPDASSNTKINRSGSVADSSEIIGETRTSSSNLETPLSNNISSKINEPAPPKIEQPTIPRSNPQAPSKPPPPPPPKSVPTGRRKLADLDLSSGDGDDVSSSTASSPISARPAPPPIKKNIEVAAPLVNVPLKDSPVLLSDSPPPIVVIPSDESITREQPQKTIQTIREVNSVSTTQRDNIEESKQPQEQEKKIMQELQSETKLQTSNNSSQELPESATANQNHFQYKTTQAFGLKFESDQVAPKTSASSRRGASSRLHAAGPPLVLNSSTDVSAPEPAETPLPVVFVLNKKNDSLKPMRPAVAGAVSPSRFDSSYSSAVVAAKNELNLLLQKGGVNEKHRSLYPVILPPASALNSPACISHYHFAPMNQSAGPTSRFQNGKNVATSNSMLHSQSVNRSGGLNTKPKSGTILRSIQLVENVDNSSSSIKASLLPEEVKNNNLDALNVDSDPELDFSFAPPLTKVATPENSVNRLRNNTQMDHVVSPNFNFKPAQRSNAQQQQHLLIKVKHSARDQNNINVNSNSVKSNNLNNNKKINPAVVNYNGSTSYQSPVHGGDGTLSHLMQAIQSSSPPKFKISNYNHSEDLNNSKPTLDFREIDALSSSIDSRWGTTDRFATELLMRTAACAAKLKSMLENDAMNADQLNSPVRNALNDKTGLTGPLAMILSGANTAEILCKLRWERFDIACQAANISTTACIIDPVTQMTMNSSEALPVNPETFPHAHLGMLTDLKYLVNGLSATKTSKGDVNGSPPRQKSYSPSRLSPSINSPDSYKNP